MKLAAFQIQQQRRLGVVVDDQVVDLHEVDPHAPVELADALRAGVPLDALAALAARAPASARRPLQGLALDLPVARPGKILCLGLNYLEHVKEGPYSVPDYPTVFLRCTSSLIAHGQPLLRPALSQALDFEAELVAVIGRRAHLVSEAQALSHVAGYACFNDGTLRDYQKRTTQWTVGKNFHGTGAFGPVFVSADELPPGATGLKIESRLNGRVMQSDNTRQMMFSVAQTVHLLSQALVLEPGDLLVMGTPSGVGYARTPPVFMRPGDRIEIEIEGVGLLSNPVEDAPA